MSSQEASSARPEDLYQVTPALCRCIIHWGQLNILCPVVGLMCDSCVKHLMSGRNGRPGRRVSSSPLSLSPFPPSARHLSPEREKKLVFLTARVHPGESPASFICQGKVYTGCFSTYLQYLGRDLGI